MTIGRSKKKLVREIQQETGWSYMQCLDLVEKLGHERVMEVIIREKNDDEDAREATGNMSMLNLDAVLVALKKEAREKNVKP